MNQTDAANTDQGGSGGVVTVQPVQDLYLHILIRMLEEGGDHRSSMNMAFNVGGGLLYGQLISHAAWHEEWSELVRQANEWAGEVVDYAFEAVEGDEKGGQAEPSHFVHLRDATFLSGGVTQRLGLWRGPLAQIGGWSHSLPEL